MRINAIHTRVFKEREDLLAFIFSHVAGLKEKDILVISSKLLCLWKGCVVQAQTQEQKQNLIKEQSDAYLQTRWAWLTLKCGMVMTNGGVDESNADGKYLCLPPDLYACAEEIRLALCRHYGLKDVGVIITDSMILPLRSGVIGAAVAYSGFEGVRDERGQKDIFGKPLEVTFVNLADALAASAAVTMGERNEQKPLCVITGAPVRFVAKTDPAEIKYPPEEDLYAPLFQAAGLIKRRTKE